MVRRQPGLVATIARARRSILRPSNNGTFRKRFFTKKAAQCLRFFVGSGGHWSSARNSIDGWVTFAMWRH